MNRNRNTVKHLLVILIAITAIVGSFYMPYLAYAYENYKLNNYDIHIDTKPMIAESEQIALTEKLDAAKESLYSDSYVPVDLDSYNSGNGNAKLSEEDALQLAKDVLVSLFAGQSVYNISDISKYKKELDNLDDVIVTPYLVVETEYMSTFLIWSVDMYKDDSNIQVYLDDETGMLLALQGYQYFCGINHVECARNGNMENIIGSYYGLHYMGRTITESMESVRNISEYSVNTMCYRYILSNENETERVSIDLIVERDPGNDMASFFYNLYDLDTYNESHSYDISTYRNLTEMFSDSDLEDYLYNGDNAYYNDNSEIKHEDADKDDELSSDTDAMPE